MNDRITAHVNSLLEGTPNTRRVADIREELLSNLNDKFNDLVSQGKSEDEAFNHVAASVGDLQSLVNEVAGKEDSKLTETAQKRKRTVVLFPVGIATAIAGVAFFFLLASFEFEDIGVFTLLIFMAAGTGLIIYSLIQNKPKYVREDDTFVEEYKEKITLSDKNTRLKGAISSALWTTIACIYFIVSFFTGRWDITWIIFIIGGIAQQIVLLPVTKRLNIGSLVWTTATVLYLVISFTTGAWFITWVIFIAAAAVQQIVRLIKIWKE